MNRIENVRKVIAKYYRLRMSDNIRSLLEMLPIRCMEESQMEPFVYLGKGELLVGTRYIPVTIKIDIADGTPIVYIGAPQAGILIESPLDAAKAEELLRTTVNNSLN